jgi:hypothetical protein
VYRDQPSVDALAPPHHVEAQQVPLPIDQRASRMPPWRVTDSPATTASVGVNDMFALNLEVSIFVVAEALSGTR